MNYFLTCELKHFPPPLIALKHALIGFLKKSFIVFSFGLDAGFECNSARGIFSLLFKNRKKYTVQIPYSTMAVKVQATGTVWVLPGEDGAQRWEEKSSPLIAPYCLGPLRYLCPISAGPWKKWTQSANSILFSAEDGFVVWLFLRGFNTGIVSCADHLLNKHPRKQEAKYIFNIYLFLHLM